MGAFSLKELTDGPSCLRKNSSTSDFNLSNLPLEILAQILALLPGKDIASASRVCRTLKQASHIDNIWQKRCQIEFGISAQFVATHISSRDYYTRLLYKYGCLLGYWQPEVANYGGLVQVEGTTDSIVGVEWLPPKKQDVRGPLRCKELFTITCAHEAVCLDGYSGRHKCLITKSSKQSFGTKCCEPEAHRHPKGDDQEFLEWAADESSPHLHGHEELLLMRFVMKKQCANSYQYSRIELPQAMNNVPIQPGVFKGTYGTHGLELVMLRYEEDGTKAVAVKISGDPNVPAGKVTFRADLSFPIVMDAEKQRDIRNLEDKHSVVPPTSPHKLPVQPFRLPEQIMERETAIPTSCKARFCGRGQIAGHGFTNPSYSPGHWIVFNEDLFGFLWLDLLCLSLFHRASEFRCSK